jgi:hypothetical protein
MSHTRMEIQALAGSRFRREGLPTRDADLVRLVDRAFRSHVLDSAAAWVRDEGPRTLPPLASLRALALLPEVAPDCLVPEHLAVARAAAVNGSTDYAAVSMANVIWAKAALHVQFPGDIIEAAWRYGTSSARATGGDASTFVQEMLVSAGLAQLRGGEPDKSWELLGYLAIEHADSPARWMILASRIADIGGAASRSPLLRGLLQECTRVALSHDDLVDLVEAAYRHGIGNPVTDLDAVRLADRDPFGLRMVHRTPLMQRASQRAYRVTRLTAALGAHPREEPSTQDDVERAYVRAVLATAAFDGLLWSGSRPPTSRLADVCHHVVGFLGVMDSEPPAVGVELIDRMLGLARRLEDPMPAISTVAALLVAWVRERGRHSPIAVEAVLALLPCRTEIAGSAAGALEQAIDELDVDDGTIASMDLRDAAHGTDACWRYLRALGRSR